MPETKEDQSEQMITDFNTVKHLYTNNVELNKTDLTQVIRLGIKKNDLTRPIKLTFVSLEKRTEILRNNRDLKLTGNFPECSEGFCNDKETRHKHIYVSPDLTKQQREEAKKLREELKQRKETETGLIIRNGKIVKKTISRARWVDTIQNDNAM